MSQLIYLAGSLAGVAALVGLCAWLFGVAPRRIDAEAAKALLRGDRPGFRAGRISLAADGRSALIEDARDGGVFIVVAQGDGLVARKLARPYLQRAAAAGDALRLHLADFTFPSARVAFADPAEAEEWAARLTA